MSKSLNGQSVKPFCWRMVKSRRQRGLKYPLGLFGYGRIKILSDPVGGSFPGVVVGQVLDLRAGL
jgi:hypothetical protein